jgi:hypothetical protein
MLLSNVSLLGGETGRVILTGVLQRYSLPTAATATLHLHVVVLLPLYVMSAAYLDDL